MQVLFIIEDTYGDHDSIGVGILSSIAKRKKWDTNLIIRLGHSTSDIIKRIKDLKPSVIAYSLATGEHRIILNLHREIKKHYSCHYIFGGAHPTYCLDFINEEGVDTICIGEGETVFENYLDRIEKNQDYSQVDNLMIKRDSHIIKNPLSPLIEDLDSIPFPDREIFKKEIPNLYKYYVFIYTSRGCPYSCAYCANPILHKLYQGKGRILRIRSVKSIIGELISLEFKPQTVIFYDDNFLTKPDSWFEEFAEIYGKKIRLPFAICTSAEKIKEPVVKLLKSVGLRSVVYALETADDEVNRILLNRMVKVDTVIEAGEVLRKYKIFSTLQNITLLPVSNPFQLDLKTLKLNQKIKPSIAVSTPLTPYPGTEMARYSIEHGYLNAMDMNCIEKINKVTTVLNFKNKSEMKKSLFIHYFFDALVCYPILTLIYKFYFLIPIRFFKLFYNIYEINFACKRYFLYLGVKFNFNNIKRLLEQYVKYKLSS